MSQNKDEGALYERQHRIVIDARRYETDRYSVEELSTPDMRSLLKGLRKVRKGLRDSLGRFHGCHPVEESRIKLISDELDKVIDVLNSRSEQ